MEYKATEFKADSVDTKARTFSGYASTWDLDQGNDIIQKGAFTKTLTERGNRVKILWQHSEPLGMPVSMREDAKGLFVEGRISKTRLGDEALELMRDGVVDQMSIGFQIPQGKSSYDAKNIRTITEVKLMEFSPVTFPMNEAAHILDVKSLESALKNGTMDKRELKNLADMLGDLTALLKQEPSLDTPNIEQPQDLKELFDSIKNWGILPNHK